MTKIFIILLMSLCFDSAAGVVVFGTSFVINDDTKRLNIKLKNDDEGEFLIKTTITCDNSDHFIITPPLFVLPKNTSNIVSVIPDAIEKDDLDHLCKLSIAAIPKSPMTKNSAVYLAIRSNLHLIYRYNDLKNADFSQLILTKNKNGHYFLINGTTSVLPLVINSTRNNELFIKKTVAPGKSIPITFCKALSCNLIVSIIADDQAVIKRISLSI